jgi:hypothetical protein
VTERDEKQRSPFIIFLAKAGMPPFRHETLIRVSAPTSLVRVSRVVRRQRKVARLGLRRERGDRSGSVLDALHGGVSLMALLLLLLLSLLLLLLLLGVDTRRIERSPAAGIICFKRARDGTFVDLFYLDGIGIDQFLGGVVVKV